jgi:hypothetical protein
MPIITPTMAQATPTGSAWRAPSTRLSRMMSRVFLPPWMNRQMATSAAITESTG